MDLYLVRHAVAFDYDASQWPDDSQRPLTPEGQKRADTGRWRTAYEHVKFMDTLRADGPEDRNDPERCRALQLPCINFLCQLTRIVQASDSVSIYYEGHDAIVLIDPPPGVNPLSVAFKPTDDEGTIGTAFPALANTVRVFYTGGLASHNRGESWPDVDFAGRPQVGAAFIDGPTRGPYTLVHPVSSHGNRGGEGFEKAPRARTLSSAQTFVMKAIFPVVWIVGFGAGTLMVWRARLQTAAQSLPPPEWKWLFLGGFVCGGAFIVRTCVPLKRVRLT